MVKIGKVISWPGIMRLPLRAKRLIEGSLPQSKFRLLVFYRFLGAKSTSIRDCVGWSVGRSVRWSVRPSVPAMQLRGKLVASRLLREEEEEEKNWLRGDSFAPRD
jgi:hypothetical protein